MRKVKPVVFAAFLSVMLVLASGCAIIGKHEKNGRESRPTPEQKLARQYESDLMKLTASVKQLRERNSLLSAEINDLRRINERYRSLLDLQDRVLQLLDDKNNTVRTMLTEEARKLNLPIESPGGERTYLSFTESDLFESGSTEIHARGLELLAALWDELKISKVKSLVIEGAPCKGAGKAPDAMSAECALSSARAAAVANFLFSGMDHAVGQVSFGTAISLRPYLPEDDSKKNPERRIDVVLELTR